MAAARLDFSVPKDNTWLVKYTSLSLRPQTLVAYGLGGCSTPRLFSAYLRTHEAQALKEAGRGRIYVEEVEEVKASGSSSLRRSRLKAQAALCICRGGQGLRLKQLGSIHIYPAAAS